MLKSFRTAAALLTCALLAAWAAPTLRAEDAPASGAKGSIKGVVYDADHHAVSGATVRLLAGNVGEHKKDKTDKTAKPNPAAAGTKTPPLAETTTDAQGSFSFPDIAAGDYTVTVGMKGVGHGMQHVTVGSGAAATCEVTLKKHEKKPAA